MQYILWLAISIAFVLKEVLKPFSMESFSFTKFVIVL